MIQCIIYSMNIELVYLLVIILGFALTWFFLGRKQSPPQTDQTLVEWLKTMQKTLDATQKTLNESLHTNSSDMVKTLQENSKQLNERLDKASGVIREVSEEVGKMNEIGRNMKELQEFLKSPKLRGNIGEHILKDSIAQMFPKESFHLQYAFRSGEKVDAAIKTDAGILPIDSKFPMENFLRMSKADIKEEKAVIEKEFIRDVKKHIDAIAKKYILPDEGTMDFALMYVPSEGVYYELVNTTELMEYARKNRVYVVSPSTLYAHLQTILLSFEGKKIEQKSKQVFQLLRALQIDYEKIDENLGVLGKHITNASAQYSNVHHGFSQLGHKLSTTNKLEEDIVEKLS